MATLVLTFMVAFLKELNFEHLYLQKKKSKFQESIMYLLIPSESFTWLTVSCPNQPLMAYWGKALAYTLT